MTSRDSLHRLVDDLPETEFVRAERMLEVLKETAAPPLYTLESAPEDNEAETHEEAAAVSEAWRDHRGREKSHDGGAEAQARALLSLLVEWTPGVPSRAV